ncbi:MAG: hypothetical protein M1839_002695 [Geoglossum umbratile]|nr:MAG: hypothetical protein M1839_002695 [Geoglossum umbratile]
MSSIAQVKIVPLRGLTDYGPWKRLIEAVLIREDLWDIVCGKTKEPPLSLEQSSPTQVGTTDSGTADPAAQQLSDEDGAAAKKANEDWHHKARQAYAILTLAITAEVGRHLEGIKDPYTIWTKLEELYTPRGRTVQHKHLQAIFRATLDSSSSVEAYIDIIKKNQKGLANLKSSPPSSNSSVPLCRICHRSKIHGEHRFLYTLAYCIHLILCFYDFHPGDGSMHDLQDRIGVTRKRLSQIPNLLRALVILP